MKQNLVFIAGLLAAMVSQAQQGGYVAVGGGMSKYNEDCSGTTNCDTTGNAFKLTGGYELFNGFAVEGVYLNFGKARARASGIDVAIKSNAVGAGGAFFARLNPSLALVARLGVARVKVSATAAGLGGTFSDSENTTKPYAGIGLTWAFVPAAYLDVGWDSTQGKLSGSKETISAFTVGVGLRF